MARATHHDVFGGCPARRTMLLGLGSTGLLAAAGCATPSSRSAGQSAGTTGGSASPAPSPAVTAGTSPGTSPAGEQSYPPWPDLGGGTQDGLVRSTDVPVGGGVLAGDYLIVQPVKGIFKAFEAKCPHQGVTVDPPLGGSAYLNCPGHNSKFKVADGSRISGPATRGLRQVAVQLKAGFVVLA